MEQKLPSVIRVAYPRSFPSVSSTCERFPTLVASVRCPLPGQLVEIISLIAKELNMEIEQVPLPEIQLNNSINRGLEMIEQGKVDIIAMGFQETDERINRFTFTKSLYKIQSRLLLTKHDNMYSGLGGFLSTYQTKTWLIMMFALVVQCILAVIIRRVEAKMKRTKTTNVVDSVWQIISLHLMKPERVHYISKAGNFSIMIFSFQCVMLFGVLSSCILSNILHPNPFKPANSIDWLTRQIMSNDKYLVSTTPNNWFYTQVNRSKTFPYDEIRKALRINPLRISRSIDETLSRVQDRAVVFVQDDDETMYRSLEHCNLMELYSELPKMTTHLLLPKNSPLVEAFNQAIKNNLIHIMRICRKYIEARKRLQQCEKKQGYEPLSLFPYIGTLIICTLMFGLASFILLMEIIYEYMRRKKLSSSLCLDVC